MSICKSIEVKLGRKKAAKNSPRVCDIDIIDFNGLILNDKLNLPHKMMHKRSFVLFPLFEIEKNEEEYQIHRQFMVATLEDIKKKW